MTEMTYLFPANTTKSLRTTVPRSIVKQFKLTENSALEWEIKIDGDRLSLNVRPIKVTKLKKKKGRRRIVEV